jgi:acetyltransferase-like isoleucine patch superfamily enzyme
MPHRELHVEDRVTTRQRVLWSLVACLPASWRHALIRWTRYGESRISAAIRHAAYRTLLRKMGDDVIIFPAVFIYGPEWIEIGSRVSIHEFSYIRGYPRGGDIRIGNAVLIAPGCIINAANHRVDEPGVLIRDSGEDYRPIQIEDDVWLGASVSVISGVRIEKGAVVGAGAVVSKSLPDHVVAVGVPAVKHRQRVSATRSVAPVAERC